MINVRFSDSSLRRTLKRTGAKTKNPKPFLKDVARHEIQAAQKRIRQRKVDPDGRRWRPWARVTEAQRRRDPSTYGRGILYQSGLLARSFKSAITKKRLKIWNTAHYAGFHQTGVRRTNLPRRRFLGWGRQARSNIERAIVKYLRIR